MIPGYDNWKLATPPEYDELPYGMPEGAFGPQEGEEEEHEDQDPVPQGTTNSGADGYPNPDVDPQLHG